MRLIVREVSSGILDLKGLTGPGERFVPDCDLDKALALLFRLYDLKAANGKTFKQNYHREGFNWLSAQVGYLYWRCCYRFVQYRPLLTRCLFGDVAPVFANAVNFERLYRLFRPRWKLGLGDWYRYRHAVPAHNRALAEKKRGGMLFYRYGPNDFRTRDILSILDARQTDLTFVYSASAKMLREKDKQPHPVYLLNRKVGRANAFNHQYDLSRLDKMEAAFFAAVIAQAEMNMTAMLRDFRLHRENLARMRPEKFFGLDDHNEVYPILFACKELGIPSVGYQLGMYARLQAAYTLERWEPGEYQWYDKVIVWGRYWEDVIRRYSRAYPADFFVLGTNKTKYSYRRLASDEFDPKNILVPYEFFANTYAIGRYVQKLIDLGWRVHFKFKPDERPERQLDCYCLPQAYRDKLIPVYDITDELMAKINVVAGAMTTLLFDLLPYGKQTWVFDTEFRLLDDMVRDGFARLVKYEELERIEPPAPSASGGRTDWSYVFNPEKLETVIEREVM